MSEQKNTKFCSNCGKEIDSKAVVCPGCGVETKVKATKKAIYKRWWFWVIVVIIAVSVISNSGNDSASNNEANTENTQQTEEITYTPYDVSELVNDLENNALGAEKKYNGQYVELTGKLSNIDSDGSYISLEPTNNSFNLVNVQCFTKNDEQINQIITLSKGDTLTVRGKITDVGELLGYSLKIDSIN